MYLHMAREVRVLAEPDFPITIFEEIKTNHMSADGINEMSAQAPKKIPLKKKKSAITKWLQQIKKVWKGFGGTFPQKVPPLISFSH